MKESQKDYRQIFKTTSIFGGVQIITILIGIIKSKFVAILLGPTGIGIMGLLSSTTQLIASIANMGLGTSAVRDVSEAAATGDKKRISTIVTVLRRWVWIGGIAGLLFTLIASSWLSQLTFGNKDYTISFAVLSITLLLTSLNWGQLAVIRGTRQIKFLAMANIYGALLGLFTSVPLYYLYGVDGIVPSLVVTAFSTLLLSWYFSKKLNIIKAIVNVKDTIQLGKGMLKLGLFMTMNSIVANAVAYLIRIYISREGSIADVGLYQAGFAIAATYVGMVFTSMSTDFYPQLAGINTDNIAVKKMVNNQAEIALLFLGPLIISMLVALPLVIIILYTKEFLPILEMTKWFLVGTIFRAGSWAVSFIFLAKGAGKLFLFNEVGIKFINVPLYLFGYSFFGLAGIGYAYALNFLIYFAWVYIVARKNYEFKYDIEFWQILMVQTSLIFIFIITAYFIKDYYLYLCGFIILCLTTWYSYHELNKRMDLNSLILRYLKK